MEPEDRWRVAIATTPRIPRRRLERVDGSPVLEIEVDLAEMSSTLPLPSPSREVDQSGTETTVPPPTTLPGHRDGDHQPISTTSRGVRAGNRR